MKKTTHAFVNPFLVCLLVTIGFGGSVGLGLVWARHQISVLANENRQLVAQIEETNRKVDEAKTLVESAESPVLMREANNQMRLGLVEMSDARIELQHVTADPVDRLLARTSELLTDRAPMAVKFALPQR